MVAEVRGRTRVAFSRWIVVVACLVAFAFVAARVPWRVQVQRYGQQMGRAPLWDPPAPPDYASFVEQYGKRGLPPEAEVDLRPIVSWQGVAFDALVALWCALAFALFVHHTILEERRDRWLFVVGHAWLGLTAAAVVCVSLWLALGGWGPPAPLLLGAIGLLCGGAAGVVRNAT